VDLVSIYYDLAKIFNDDIDCVAHALKELAGVKKVPYYIKQELELLRLKKFDKELNYLYDMKMDELKAFAEEYIRKTAIPSHKNSP